MRERERKRERCILIKEKINLICAKVGIPNNEGATPNQANLYIYIYIQLS